MDDGKSSTLMNIKEPTHKLQLELVVTRLFMVDPKNKWTVFVGVWSPNPKRTPIGVGAVS